MKKESFTKPLSNADSWKTPIEEMLTKLGITPKIGNKSGGIVMAAPGRITSADQEESKKPLDEVAPKQIGKLDMVIAFDTTGSMAAYIGAVRQEVADLIPKLFKNNPDLRLGIVAFGDYCDMKNSKVFGNAYQCIMPTDNENELIRFIKESKDTSGGDGDEFYELVIKKIAEETPWRENSSRSILLIADAEPHDLGYSYRDIILGNQIDWREEARKAAEMKIKIDTVTITNAPWFRELSALTNGTSVPFHSGYKTGRLVEAAIYAKGSLESREFFDTMEAECIDDEMKEVYSIYRKEREDFDM